MLENFPQKKDFYVRPESVIFSGEMSILQTRTYWKAGTSQGHSSSYVTPKVMVIKMSKITNSMYVLLDTVKYQFQFEQDIQVHL